MSGEFWVDTEQLRAAAPAFEQLGERMDTIFTTLRGKLEAEGHCWGNDDYGRAFEKDYKPGRDNAMQFFPQMSAGLKDITSGLMEGSDTADRGDDATHQKFQT